MGKAKSNYLGLSGKNVKERLDIILGPINISSSNNLYYRLISLFKLLPLACKNMYGLSLGSAGMGKSKVYELLDTNAFSGIPTVASLRGNANSNESKALLEYDFILFEEVAEGNVQPDALGLLKETSTKKNFLKSNNEEIVYKGSYVMNFNYYGNENSLEKIEKENFRKVLPPVVGDDAFLSRMSFVLAHNNGTVGKPAYKNTTNISSLELKEYLLAIREREFSFEKFTQTIFGEIENYSEREKENITKVLGSILLILYPEYREEDALKIPNYVVEGFLNIAILATNEYGRKQNEKEFLLFKKGSMLGLKPIESKNNYHELSYTKESGYILSNKLKIDEDKIELETYRAREKQRELLNKLKGSLFYYIDNYFKSNILYFPAEVFSGTVYIEYLSKIPYGIWYYMLDNIPDEKEKIIAYFKSCIEYICDIEKAHNHVLEVKKFLTSFPNLFDIKELEFLDSYSVTLDIEISKGIICKEIDQINKEKIRKSIGFDTNLEDEYYLYYVEEETLSPRIFIL